MKPVNYDNINSIVRISAKPMTPSLWYKKLAKPEISILGIILRKKTDESWVKSFSFSHTTYSEAQINKMHKYIMHNGMVYNRAEIFIGYSNSEYNQTEYFPSNEECQHALTALLSITEQYNIPIVENLLSL